MTKKGYMPKLLVVLAGAILCLCVAALATTGIGAESARAEDLPADKKLSLETVDEFATHGYKIEAANADNDSDANPFDSAENPYDYIITVVDKTSSWWMPRGGKLYFEENSHEAVWNIKTPSGKKVTGGGDYKWSKIHKTTSTDSTIGAFTYDNNEKIIYPDTGDRAENGTDWKTGETVMTFSFKEGSGSNSCTTHGERVPCTCWIDGDGQGEVLTGMTLRVLYRVVHVEDTTFTFSGAVNDLNNNPNGMWLNFAATDVHGLVVVNKNGDDANHAERFMATSNAFFRNVYFLENVDYANATLESVTEQLAGNDLYTLMGDLSADKPLFETHVRNDHVEIMRNVSTGNPEAPSVVNFEAGNAFYLKAGLKMIGYDGNGNWTVAAEGGAANVLARDQFFYFDGTSWTIDQFGTGITLDKRDELLETEATLTITATPETGKFADAAATVAWETGDATIATVTNGVVTGVAAGETTITAKYGDGVATCKVTVVRADQIDKIELDKRNVVLYTGDAKNTYTFVATVTGGSKIDKTVTWTSSNTAVATVDASGKVTSVAEGTTTITATAADGTTTATATVKVLQAEEEPSTGDDDNKGDDDKGDKKGGCGSAAAGSSAAVGGVLALAAIVLALRKKKVADK